jgi:hypothetical protein
MAKKLSQGHRTGIHVTSPVRDRLGDQFTFGTAHPVETEGMPTIDAWELVS